MRASLPSKVFCIPLFVSKNIQDKICTNIILPVVFCVDVKLGFSHCGRNTPRVFENRVLRKICGPKRDEVTGE
jgi:hypothetical protein